MGSPEKHNFSLDLNIIINYLGTKMIPNEKCLNYKIENCLSHWIYNFCINVIVESLESSTVALSQL
jgi:hypothetical protein